MCTLLASARMKNRPEPFMCRQRLLNKTITHHPMPPLPRVCLHCQRPLVQCITNQVSMDLMANVLLAAGLSPAMAHDPRESADFQSISSALLLNLGTLDAGALQAGKLAAAKVGEGGRVGSWGAAGGR